jgi:hypothetical protein
MELARPKIEIGYITLGEKTNDHRPALYVERVRSDLSPDHQSLQQYDRVGVDGFASSRSQINERQWWTVPHQAWDEQPEDPHERVTWFLIPGLVRGRNNLFLLKCEVEWSGKREDYHHVYDYDLEKPAYVEGKWVILTTRWARAIGFDSEAVA